MKVCYEGFAGAGHSWALVAQGICRELYKRNNIVHIKSTNTYKYFPNDLNKLINEDLKDDYDLEFSYTAMKNFPIYLNHSKKSVKLGIWCYEFAGKNALPDGFAKNYKHCHKLLPPSNFAKEVFLDSGIPDSCMEVVPHGIDLEKYINAKKIDLKTNKKYKIGCFIFQPHIRKNLRGTLEAYGKAFTKKDDVCLVMKVIDKKPEQPFELQFSKLFNEFKNKYKNHAEVVVLTEYIENIQDLYNSCDIILSLSHSECFSFPMLEGLATNKIVISSNYGGQLDFLNKNNSILIDGKIINAPPQSLYWQSKNNTKYFDPNIDDAVDKLKYAINNYDNILKSFEKNIANTVINYSWEDSVDKIIKIKERLK